MTIRDLLAAESINLNGTPAGKTEALNQCIDLMAKSGKIADVEKYRKGVFAREEEGTTGIGMGIAIPHCKSDAVTKAGLAAMVVKDGVDFESLDGTPAKIIFLIAAPNTEDNVHLQVLSKLSLPIRTNCLRARVSATLSLRSMSNPSVSTGALRMGSCQSAPTTVVKRMISR